MNKILTIILFTIVSTLSYSQTLDTANFFVSDRVVIEIDSIINRNQELKDSVNYLRQEILRYEFLNMKTDSFMFNKYNSGYEKGYEFKYYFFKPHFRKKYFFYLDN
jgi:hypothetical protein